MTLLAKHCSHINRHRIALLMFLTLWISFTSTVFGQENPNQKLTVNGYIKQLTSLISFESADDYSLDVLLHNRLNLKWYLSDKWTFTAEMRNRMFIGDQVRMTPGYGSLIDEGSNDWIDLSAKLIDTRQTVLHSYFDRLYIEYTSGKWEMRIGRQRINWGQTTNWNPNDIFNAYAFTDFDYEERPGADAIRIKRYYGFSSSMEFAFRPSDSLEYSTAALMWRFNKWTYDFQLIGGVHERDLVFGFGWAGNIKNAGFKGEMSYFAPTLDDRKKAFSAALNFDYAFNWGLYWNVGVLYNSEGGFNTGFFQLFNTTLNARNLYPYRWSIMSIQSAQITPLMTAALVLVYSPVKSNALYAGPTLTLSVATNWDLDIVSQVLFESDNGKYSSPLQAYFVRIKHSF